MNTSVVVYIPTGSKKAALAAIADVEYQLGIRAIRKGMPRPLFGKWRNCRYGPGVWELKVMPPTLPATIRFLSELQSDDGKLTVEMSRG